MWRNMPARDTGAAAIAADDLRKITPIRRGRVRDAEPATPAATPIDLPDFAALRDTLTRRRRGQVLAAAGRTTAFILVPTLAAWAYFAGAATPLFQSEAAFVIKAGDPAVGATASGLMAQTMSASGTAHDAMTLQAWLESRNALDRLEAEVGFRSLFVGPEIDPLQRLSAEATAEDVYRLYRRKVRVGFDPTEGVMRLSVETPDPEASLRIADALLGYAAERIDVLTKGIREDRLQDARTTLEEARIDLATARQALVDLEETLSLLSDGGEESLLGRRIGGLEEELSAARVDLATLNANRRPNAARVAALGERIVVLEAEIALQRREISGAGGTLSLARARSEVEMARGEVETRREIHIEAMRQLEVARAAAARQSRYLAVSVEPRATDEQSWPQAPRDTGLAFLVILGLYAAGGVTVSVLREQMSS